MAKGRSWAGETAISGSDRPNTKALQDASAIVYHSSIEDAVAEFGGTRGLAESLKREGDTRKLSSIQRNIQRWLNYERGTGKESSKPSKAGQANVNRAVLKERGTNGATVSVNGTISVNGYKRVREVEIPLSEDELMSFLENASWEALADAYNVNEFHAYGDVSISIEMY
jgi:hypothetical protein